MICTSFVTCRPYTQAKNGRETTVPTGLGFENATKIDYYQRLLRKMLRFLEANSMRSR